MITPLVAPSCERQRNAAGMMLAEVRAEVAAAAGVLRDSGDRPRWVVDGGELLSDVEAVALLPDGLHPDADGYRVLAERLEPHLGAALDLAAPFA